MVPHTAIRMLYRNTKVKFRSPDGNTDFFDIVAGVLQGDTLAPYLFIICLDYVLRMSSDLIKENGFMLKKKKKGKKQTLSRRNYNGHRLCKCTYSSRSLLHNLDQAAGGIGLYVNPNKMKYVCFKRKGTISTLNSGPLKLVDEFTYLGSSISSTESDVNMHL